MGRFLPQEVTQIYTDGEIRRIKDQRAHFRMICCLAVAAVTVMTTNPIVQYYQHGFWSAVPGALALCVLYMPFRLLWKQWNGQTYPNYNHRTKKWFLKNQFSTIGVMCVDATEYMALRTYVQNTFDSDNVQRCQDRFRAPTIVSDETMLIVAFKNPADAILFKLRV